MLYHVVLTPVSAPYLIFLWQKQQTQMQEVLRQLSQQQNLQRKETQQSPRQQLSSESLEHNVLIQSLKKIVSEKEAKIKQLEEEVQQLSLKVINANIMLHFPSWERAITFEI